MEIRNTFLFHSSSELGKVSRCFQKSEICLLENITRYIYYCTRLKRATKNSVSNFNV